jgi:hypothetical protein
MSVKTYEGRIQKGQLLLKDSPRLAEGTLVYLVVPTSADEGTAFDPTPMQIASDIRAAMAEFAFGELFEIESAEDLARLVAELSLENDAP